MSKEKSTTRPKKSVGQVAENIKKYRKLAGISQDQLSKKADLAFHTIAKIEAGSTPNPTIETVAKIAKALEVSVDDLLNKSKACLPVRSRGAVAIVEFWRLLYNEISRLIIINNPQTWLLQCQCL